MHEVNVPKASLRGSSFAPKCAGSLHPDGGPTGVFRNRGEEFIAIMVMPYQWSQMIKAMNMPELADDPRFNTPRARRDNDAALKQIIEGLLAFRAAVRLLRRWKRSVCLVRRFSRCTRPWAPARNGAAGQGRGSYCCPRPEWLNMFRRRATTWRAPLCRRRPHRRQLFAQSGGTGRAWVLFRPPLPTAPH
jgi:CoA transferase family III